ncbi:hypothetical protein D3C87_2103750 [compost metagenome]
MRARGEGADGKALRPSAWKEVWSAGQGVGLIDEVKGCGDIVRDLMAEYEAIRTGLPSFS